MQDVRLKLGYNPTVASASNTNSADNTTIEMTSVLNATGDSLMRDGSLRFSQLFRLDGSEPQQGSIAGGTLVTINGSGLAFDGELSYHKIDLVFNDSRRVLDV